MSSKYATSHTIPEGLPKLLKDFTREVLRNQPANIYAYGASYFKALLDTQPISKFEEHAQTIAKLFSDNDPEQSGFVLFEVVKAVLSDESVGLSDRLIQMAMLEFEINDEGYCLYDDFVKNCTRILDEAEESQPNPHPENHPRIHIHGVLRDEFERQLAQKFQEYHINESGALDRKAIRDALNDEDLGLRNKEINLLMQYVETNHPDGNFDINELATDSYDLLFNAHEENTLNLPFDYRQVEDHIIRAAEDMDVKEAPRKTLSPLKIMSTLFNCNLGFTSLQAHAIIGLLATLTQDVNYVTFAHFISHWVADYQQGTDLNEVGNTVIGLDREALKQRLQFEFSKADTEESGFLPFEKIISVISTLPFTPRERSAVLAYALPEDDEKDELIPYQPVIDNAFNVCITQSSLGLHLLMEDQTEEE